MIIYRKVIKSYIHTIRYMGYEHFLNPILKINLVLNPFFLLDPDPFRFCLDPDPYHSSPWIRIRKFFFHILDPDPYQNDTDPPHCGAMQQEFCKVARFDDRSMTHPLPPTKSF